MAIRKQGRYWHIYWKENGKIYSRSTGSTVKAEAERIDAVYKSQRSWERSERIKRRLFSGISGAGIVTQTYQIPDAPKKEHKRGSIRLDAMFETALQYRKLSVRHRRFLNHFIRWTDKKFADEITPQIALEYLRSNFGEKKSKTYNNHKTILNTIFRLCAVEVGKPSPFALTLSKRVIDDEHRRNFSKEEFDRIIENATAPWKFLTKLSWFTGMPKEVCFRFCPAMLQTIDGVIWCRYLRGKTAAHKRECQLPLPYPVLKMIKNLHPKTPETPFVTCIKPAISGKQQDLYFGKLLRRLEILDNENGIADFHSLRSSFITRCDEAGIPRHTIQSMVGHVDGKTTNVYSHDTKTPLLLLKVCQ